MLKIIFGIIVGFLIAFFLIKNEVLKLNKTSPSIQPSSSELLSITDAEVLVKNNWPDIVVPKCNPGEEVCPRLLVSVLNSKNARTGLERTSMVFADVVGFTDDSYAGERRQSPVYLNNGNWVLSDYSEFTLCRDMRPSPKGAPCP